jgi:hypothetical protein
MIPLRLSAGAAELPLAAVGSKGDIMKKAPKKIALTRETLDQLDRVLKPEELEQVAGGNQTGKRTCDCP